MKYLIRFICIGALFVAAVPMATAEESPCADCHEAILADMAETAHSLEKRGAPTCQACHGEGLGHMEKGDTESITVPDDKSGEAVCRTCHNLMNHTAQPTEMAEPMASFSCFTCHSIHGSDPLHRPLLVDETEDLCKNCHQFEAASFSRPFGHNLNNAIQCLSCHEPGGGRGRQFLRQDHSGQGPCVTCHAEKRGPYVYSHLDGIGEGCLSCHQPHGSTNPVALNRPRIDQLCLECHSPITGGFLGSEPPSTHDVRYPKWRNCTVCHVAIHGSNTSPALLR